MRRFLLSALATLVCLPVLNAQVITDGSTAVPALVKNFLAAEQAYDAAALSKLVSKDYVEVSPAGEVDRHDRFLCFYTADKKQPWPPTTLTDEEVRVFGDTAIEIAKQSYTLPGPDGQPHTREVRCTFIARREGGAWRLIGSQFTGIRPAPSAHAKP